MKAILSALVTRHRFSLVAWRAVTPVLRSITMEPRGGVPVAIHHRPD
jgi:cytochrome P450